MKKSLLFCLFALTLAATVGAQNNLKAAYKAPNGVPDFLNVCGDPDLAIVQVTAEGLSAAARKNITATIQLFKGVELIALDPATTTAGVVLVNNSNKNQPVLSLPDVSPGSGETIFIGLRIAADCGYTDTIGANNDAEVFDSWAFSYKIGSQNFTETDKLAEYRTAFKTPSFTIAVDNTAPPSRVGDCFARRVVCANSALEGFADSVLYTDLLGAGISLQKLYIGGLEIPFTKTKVGNDTLITAMIYGSWIQTAKIGNLPGDGDVFFDPNESLIIREDICMVNCTGSRLSSHSASWGCKNAFCHTVSADGFARIGDGQPNALITNISQNTPKVGYCKSGNNVVRYKNTGQAIDPGFADMLNVSINIGMGPMNLLNFNGFIADSMTVASRAISPLVNVLNLDNNPLFNTDPDGPGGLADIDGDGFFDDLPADAQFDAQIFFDFDCSGAASVMQDSICLNEYTASWNTVLSYTDPCKIKQSKSLPNFGSIQNSNEEYVNCADPDTYVNDTFEIMHVETRGVRGFEKSCNGEERFFLYVIPPTGVNPVLSSFKIYKNNSTTSLALLSSEQRGDTLFTYWDASSQFVGGKYDIRVYFIPDCNATPGRLDIPLAFGFECPPCGCSHLWYCEKIHGPQFHRTDPPCSGAPICQIGTATTFFDASRTTFGWADLDYTIPFNPAEANKKVAIPCDIVRMRLFSVVGQTPLTDSLGAIIRYDHVEDEKGPEGIFEFNSGFLQIRKGGTLYQCPIDTSMLEVFKTDSTKMMRFDFAHCMDSLGITLTAGDSVNFYADMSLNPDGPYIKNFRKIPLFRGWTFATIDSTDYSCDSYGENFFVGKNPTAFAQPGGSDFPKGCSNTPLQYRLLTINNGFKDYFGLEYRQSAKIDSISFDYDPELLNRFQDIAFEVSIPGHPVFGNTFFAVPPFSAADNGHYVARFDTLTRVPSLNLVQNYAFNYRIKLTPTCESEFGSSDLNNQFKLEPRIHFHDRFYAQNIGDGSCVADVTDGVPQKLNYTDRPIFDFEAVTNPNILLGTDTAVWDIKQCNISTKSDALLTWLSAVYDSTELEVVAIQEVSNPNSVIDFTVENYGAGKRFAVTPALYRNSATNLPDAICNTIRIKAKVKKCGTSQVALHMGWNCAAFPDTAWTPELYPPCADDTMTISVTTLDPSLDATIVNQPPQFAEFCDTIPLEFLVRNTGQGNTYKNTTRFTIPLSGATLVPGSIQIAWPSNAPFKNVLGLPTFVGLSPRGRTYEYTDFSLLDSTLAQTGLPGFNPLEPDSTNEFILKIAFETGCEFRSGTYSFYAINGKKVCDEPTNKETGESLPIYFNGLTAPSNKSFGVKLQAGTFSAGAGSSNLELSVWNKMATPTDTFDKIQLKLPVNVNFQNGSAAGLTPAGWLPGNPTIQQIDSIQILTWTLPVGMVLNDTARLSFTAAGSSISCGEPLEAGLSVIRLTDANCQSQPTPCQMGVITSENGEEFIQILVGDESDFASADASICPNGSTQLSLTGSFVQTTWSPEDGLSDPNIPNPVASPAVTTTYTLSALDANGCLKIDHVTVSVGGQLNIASTITDASCGMSNGQISLAVTGGSGSYTYQWLPGVSTSNSTPATLSAGDFLVTVTDQNGGCSATDVFTIMEIASNVSINLTATAASNLNPQSGAILVQITGNSAPYSVYWTGASDGSEINVAGPNFNITNLFSGSYDVVILDKFGCAATATALIPLDNINNLSLVAMGTADTTCCGGAGMVFVTPTGGNGIYTYQWSPAVSTSNMAAGLAPGIYSITVTDGFGLTAVAAAMVADACVCDIFPEIIYEPAGIEALCLPIPYIYRDEVGLAVNGVPYAGPYGVCDLDTVVYYGFGFVNGVGYDGPYRLDSWSCNNMPVNNILFNDIEELADIMNTVDPYGFWVIDPDSKAIYGGDIDQIVYSQMKITHLNSHTPYILGVNYTQFAYGTEIYVQPFGGKIVITGYDSLTCCNDMTCVIFLNPCEDLVPTEPYAVFTGSNEVCIDVPFADTDSMKFFLDRDQPLAAISPCFGGAGTNIYLSITEGIHELIIFDLRQDRLCADTVAVLGFGNLPTPQFLSLQTPQDSSLTQICVDTSEFYGQLQTLNFIDPPTNGTVNTTASGYCFDYSPAAGFYGNDSMTVILKDEWGVSDTTYFNIFVKSPTVTTDIFYLTTPFQTPIQNICAIVNEIAATGLSLTVCDQPSNGVMTIQGNSCSTYTPNNGFWGLDTTCILLCNNVGQCDTTLIYITVLPPNGSSIDTINIITTLNTAVTNCFPITLPGIPTSFSFCEMPTNGTVTGSQGNPACITYTPNTNFIGTDLFSVKICTDFGACDTTVFLVTVNPTPPPTVTKDTVYITTNFNTPTTEICPPTSEIGGLGFTTTLCSTVPNGSVSLGNNCAVFTPTNGFSGNTEFCIQICNNSGICDTTIVIATVLPDNTPFITKDTIYITTDFDTPTTPICPITAQIGGTGFNISLCSTISNGTIDLPGICAIFTPSPGFIGNTEFCLQICNNTGVCDTSIVIVTVLPAPPSVITKDTIEITTPFETATGPICPDPSQLTGGNIAIALCAPATNGTISFTINNCVNFTPASGFVGETTLCVQLCDNTGACDTTIILITVLPETAPPAGITKDTIQISTDFQTSTVPICPSISQLPSGALTISLCSPVNNGVTSLTGNNCVVFTPEAAFLGQTIFCVQLCTSNNVCDTTLIIVTVNPITPVGLDKDTIQISTLINTPTSSICVDTTELLGTLSSISLCEPLTTGNILFNQNYCLSFSPDSNFIGLVNICVQICDNTGTCDTTIVLISVNPVLPPVSTLDTITITVNQDTIAEACVNAIDLTAPIINLTVCGQPTNGTLDLSTGLPCVIYDPADSYEGMDQFCLIACDSSGICDTTIVVVSVTGPIINPPSVTKDTISLILAENTVSNAFCIDLSELTGPISSLDFCSPPSSGLIAPASPNCFNYTPNIDFVGNDQSCIVVCSGLICDTTIISITVTPLPSPEIDTVFATIQQDSLFEYCLSDAELNTAIDSVSSCGGVTIGTITVTNGIPCFQFEPNQSFIGIETFCMVACDSIGLCDTTVFVITVVSDSTTQIPTTVDTLFLSTNINTSVAGCVNLNQIPGGLNFIGLCNGASNGQVTFTPGDPCFAYTPASNFVGIDSFCVIACNDVGVCDTTLVYILTNSPTDTSGNFPTSLDTIYVSVLQDSVLNGICLTFDNLPAGFDTISFCQIANNGTAIFATDSCVNYTPNTGYIGLDNFCVVACDSIGNCDTTVVIVLVTPVNPSTGVLTIDTIQISVLLNSPSPLTCIDLSEIGGSATSFSICDSPSNGGILQMSGFCIVYTPNSGFVGLDTACVVVCNGIICDTTILIFQVQPPLIPDCGILPDDSLTYFVNSGDTLQICLDLPLDQVPLFDIFDNGLPYSMGYSGCNFDTMLAYTYFTIPGLGQLGPYSLDKWTVNGTTFSGNFANIKALVDSMNVWDPGCSWTLDPTTLTIRGGCFNNSYGNIQVTQLSTLGVAVIELNQFLNPMGTQVSLLPGEHTIIIQGVDCTDTLLINVFLNPEITIDTVVFVGATDTLCLSDYGFSAIDSVSLNLCPNLNGTNVDFEYDTLTNCLIYTGQSIGVDTFCIQVCEADSCVLISILVASIQPVPCSNFLGVDSLSFNSPTCDTSNIIACTGLAFIMAQNYLVLDNNNPVGITGCPPDANGIQSVGVVLTSVGQHLIVFNNPTNNCKDTLIVSIGCPDPTADLVDTVFVGQTDSICFDNLGYVSIENACENLSGILVDFIIDTTNFCVIYTGIAVGNEPACIVLCNAQGLCDTLNLLVTVIPVDTSAQLPPIAVDDLNNNTSTNNTVTIPVLNNDTINGQLVSIKILQQPDHGIAIINNQNVIYEPNQDYCDSQNADSLLYEICNAVGCDTAWVSVTIACTDIIIYNGFSPNNDGMNEVFYIDGIQFFPENDLKIFNRWGNEVFKTDAYKNDWHGTFEEKTLPDGVYYYIFHDGTGREWSGYLTILR